MENTKYFPCVSKSITHNCRQDVPNYITPRQTPCWEFSSLVLPSGIWPPCQASPPHWSNTGEQYLLVKFLSCCWNTLDLVWFCWDKPSSITQGARYFPLLVVMYFKYSNSWDSNHTQLRTQRWVRVLRWKCLQFNYITHNLTIHSISVWFECWKLQTSLFQVYRRSLQRNIQTLTMVILFAFTYMLVWNFKF